MVEAADFSEGREAAVLLPLLVKRYASRRLYNTETSDYVTLDDIAAVIRSGRDVKIVDLKSGDDLTRQYLLQIIAEHESRGENVLPVEMLTDLVRSYASNTQSVVPAFLAASFAALRAEQSGLMEQVASAPASAGALPRADVLRQQQQAFLKAMMASWPGATPQPRLEVPLPASPAQQPQDLAREMAEIRRQLAELQNRVAKL